MGHVGVMFMLRCCYVDGRGGVGWGMLASCSCYVDATLMQQGDEVEATTSKKGLTINMCRFMLTFKFTANTKRKRHLFILPHEPQ